MCCRLCWWNYWRWWCSRFAIMQIWQRQSRHYNSWRACWSRCSILLMHESGHHRRTTCMQRYRIACPECSAKWTEWLRFLPQVHSFLPIQFNMIPQSLVFLSGTSSFNEMRILLTVLRQSMATSIHSLVSSFEYFSTYVRPSQLSVPFVGGTTQRFDKIRQDIPPREEPTAPYSTRRSRADAALIVSTLQGLMWQLSSPSTKVMLLPIATLLFDAMQRLTSPSPIAKSAVRAQDIGDCGGYGGNEYLVAGFMCVLHAIEELHAVDMAAVKLAMESMHPALESKIKTSTVLQLLDGLEWLVCRDSLRLENNYKGTRRQIGFALGQVLPFIHFEQLWMKDLLFPHCCVAAVVVALPVAAGQSVRRARPIVGEHRCGYCSISSAI